MAHLAASQGLTEIKQLLDHTQSELDELFLMLPAPENNELSGVYRGTLMAIVGLGWLPRFLRVLLYRILQTAINPWAGKRFQSSEGANIWFSRKGKYPFGYYSIADNQIGIDAYPLTFLSYDVEKNPSFLRAIRGEVRKLNDTAYLARMNYVTSKRTHRVLYFALEKQTN